MRVCFLNKAQLVSFVWLLEVRTLDFTSGCTAVFVCARIVLLPYFQYCKWW